MSEFISYVGKERYLHTLASAQSGAYSVAWSFTGAYPTVRLCAGSINDILVEHIEFSTNIDAPVIVTVTDAHGYFTNSADWVAGAQGYNKATKRGDAWAANVRVTTQSTPTAVATGRAMRRWRGVTPNRSTAWEPKHGILVRAGSSLDIVVVNSTVTNVLDVNFEYRDNL